MIKLTTIATICCLIVPTLVFAQGTITSPAYYEVTDVAADDVLNIRAEPDAGAEIVGSFLPGAAPVEVLYTVEGWAYVSAGERMGWTSARFLTEIEVPKIADSDLPQGLVCAGTEPFWSLAFEQETAFFNAIDAEELQFDVTDAGGFGGAGPNRQYVLANGAGFEATAIMGNEICSDGMSARAYPRRFDMVMTSQLGTSGYTGCCSVPVN